MKIFIFCVSVFICQSLAAQQTGKPSWESYVKLSDYLQPFWLTDTVYGEQLQPIKQRNNLPEASLLFMAKKIVSVKDVYLQKEYKKGKDWRYKDGKIILTAKSSIPYFSDSDLLFDSKKEGVSLPAKNGGKYVLFSEKGLLQSRQLSVTYVKEKSSEWKGPIPVVATEALPGTLTKLKEGVPLKIVFYGNSIETGANSSITQNESPYLPTWPEMIVYNLQHFYKGVINAKNVSKGGMAAKWGLEQTATLVNPEKPDLVVIGFGMNDGTSKVPPDTFISQINGIIEAVKADNPTCEFIVISTMLANPDAIHSQIQNEYLQPINKLASVGVAIADMTSIHEELLRHKSYQDMTGNNINHPNDYLARWYAQVISALLMSSGK